MKIDFSRITKKQAKLIFLFFSVLLLMDYPILPLLISILEGKNNCNDYDNLITCIGLSFLFFVIIQVIWFLIFYNIYETYFMSEEDKEKLRKSRFTLIRLKARNADYIESVYGNEFGKKPTVNIAIFFCLGIIYIFLSELHQIGKLIFDNL